MYDQILLNDLKSYRHNLDNINEQEYRQNHMQKVIRCRTQDKFYLLKCLYLAKYIDILQYRQYMQIAEDDCKKAILYIMGMLTLTDIE